MIPKTVKKAFEDCQNLNLPTNIDSYDKIHGKLLTGRKFYWYYKSDFEFFNNKVENVKNHLNDIYSGIIVPVPDTINNYGELDIENCIVVVNSYPVEMEYCEVDWVALNRLLDDKDLIEFFDIENS